MAKKRIFVSFDYDHDGFLKEAIIGQSKNPDSPFDFIDASLKEPLTGDWRKKIEPRIEGVDQVIVLCGEYTTTATGVAAELKIAQELGVQYFLLWGYPEKTCIKPIGAKATDQIYKWTWDNLKALIGGAR